MISYLYEGCANANANANAKPGNGIGQTPRPRGSRNELCEGDPNCKVARPTCNFIRHTLTFFSRCRSFPRANAQKGEDSCKGKAANAELDFYRNKSIIFWPSVIHHLFRGK